MRSWARVVSVLACYGRPATDAREPAPAVVEDGDALEEGGLGVTARGEPGSVDQLRLRRAEDALHRRVVEAIALAASRGERPMRLRRSPQAYRAVSTGRRDTLLEEVAMAKRKRRSDKSGRAKLRSP